MCLTGNAYAHQEWECASPVMHILTRNEDVPHRECTSMPGNRVSISDLITELYLHGIVIYLSIKLSLFCVLLKDQDRL